MTPDYPLTGKLIINTRPAGQAWELSQLLIDAGAEVFEFPLVEIFPGPDKHKVAQVVREAEPSDWLVFTSANGVRMTFTELTEDPELYAKARTLRCAVIGPATAATLIEFGIVPGFVSRIANSKDFAFEFSAFLRQSLLAAPNVGVTLLRSSRAGNVLPELLMTPGVVLKQLAIYGGGDAEPDLVLVEKLRKAIINETQQVSMLLLTSSDGVHNLLRRVTTFGSETLERLRKVPVVVIGPLTASSAKAMGLNVVAVSNEAHVRAVVSAVVRYFNESITATKI